MWLVQFDSKTSRTLVPQDTWVSSGSIRAIVHSMRTSHDRQIAARFSGVGAKSAAERTKEQGIKDVAYPAMQEQYESAFTHLLANTDANYVVKKKWRV